MGGAIMPQIIPIKELKDTTKISEMCHKNDEPVFVTKNGYGDMVLMSMEVFEDMSRRLELYRELAASERQFEMGQARDGHSVLSDLRGKYGL